MKAFDNRYLALSGGRPAHIPHWEHWSHPEAESFLTGIDHYERPRSCRARLLELFPDLGLGEYDADMPLPRPETLLAEGDETEAKAVRWGDSVSGTWEHGEALFHSDAEVLNFRAAKQLDFRDFPVVENFDYRQSDEELRAMFAKNFGVAHLREPEPGMASFSCFYNTTIMWPILTFGWELFLLNCLEPEFEAVMADFAVINRRVFRIFARLPTNFVLCHDDLCTTRGPVCSQEWMHRYLFPRYEEYWDMLRAAGKKVIFIGDGNIDAVADDLVACGAAGLISEPMTDFRGLARRYPQLMLAGEGDNRILSSGNPGAVRAMVAQMTETAHMMDGGYFYCVGNHLPWNLPPEMVKLYLELCRDSGVYR